MKKLNFTRLPERGDAVLGELSTGKVLFLRQDSFSSVSDIDASKYEIIGAVAKRDGKNVLIVYKENAARKWADRYSYKLTVTAGATSGKLSVREASDSWAANHEYTISWTNEFADDATHRAEVIAALNAYFAANAPFSSSTQDWVAEEVNNEIHVHFAYTAWQQSSYDSASAGFGLTANLLPEIPSVANMRRKHGGNGGEGAISNWYRALAYFEADNSSTTYNPSSDVTSIKRDYPVCLPAYLGTSTYQSDHCALLRETYGEGREGWLKFMASCLPVVPTDWGNMGMDFGMKYTNIMAAKMYTSQAKSNPTPLCPAAYYCRQQPNVQALPKAKWYMPTTKEVYDILDGIVYGTIDNRNADALNMTLNKLGATAIANSSIVWSSLRCDSYVAWRAGGSGGFFGNGGMYISYLAIPVSLYELA